VNRSKDGAAALVDEALQLASLPEVVTRLDSAIANPYSTLEEIRAIIEADPAIAARLLKLANSAMYGYPGRVETVREALTIIGTRQLRDLVLAACVIDLFHGVFGRGVTLEKFWRHSIACGLAARLLATLRREANVERAYLIGLLHDVGRLVLLLRIPEEARSVLYAAQSEHALLYAVEQERLGFDHAEVGGLLLERWGLPTSLSEPVSRHHTPDEAHLYPQETATVHVADVLTNALQYGGSGEPVVPPLAADAWRRLDLSENHLELLVAQLDEQFRQTTAIFLGRA